jgi:hypothetical protein
VGVYPIFCDNFHFGEHIFCLFHFGSGTLPPPGLLGRRVPARDPWRGRVPPTPQHLPKGGPPLFPGRGCPPSHPF